MMRWLATVALLGATALVVLLNPPRNLALGRAVLQALPATFGPWNGTELSFEDAVVEELKADDILIRRYDRGGERVWLCVVYHENRRYGAHDPRLCYESQGWLLEPERRARVGGDLDVNRFVATRGRERRVVYYWWATRGLATADAGAFRRAQALGGAIENRSWGAFVRVEALVGAEDEAVADRAAGDFAARVATALPAVIATPTAAR
jgi:EpsI family protein